MVMYEYKAGDNKTTNTVTHTCHRRRDRRRRKTERVFAAAFILNVSTAGSA
jgi:hypothetical protein